MVATNHPDVSLADMIAGWGRALTVGELASVLSVSRKTLYKMVESGRIPHLRVFGSIRFDPAKTAEWLRSKTIGTKGR